MQPELVHGGEGSNDCTSFTTLTRCGKRVAVWVVLASALFACGKRPEIQSLTEAAGWIRRDVRNQTGIDSFVNVTQSPGGVVVIVSLQKRVSGDPTLVRTTIVNIVKRDLPSCTQVEVFERL